MEAKIGTLQNAWDKRLKLIDEADKFGSKRDEHWKKADKLYEKADKLWIEAILEAYKKITIGWKWNDELDDYECHLENGDIYYPILKEK